MDEEEGGEGVVEGGGGRVLPCAPSALTQIVPISAASIYTVFHSVIFNSVTHAHHAILFISPAPCHCIFRLLYEGRKVLLLSDIRKIF